MAMTPWFDGKPPGVGWYVASYEVDTPSANEMRRYWDGRQWSAPVWVFDEETPPEHFERARHRRGENQRSIRWRASSEA